MPGVKCNDCSNIKTQSEIADCERKDCPVKPKSPPARFATVDTPPVHREFIPQPVPYLPKKRGRKHA